MLRPLDRLSRQFRLPFEQAIADEARPVQPGLAPDPAPWSSASTDAVPGGSPRHTAAAPEPSASGRPVEDVIRFVHHGRAHRYVLRVEPDGSLRVTVPRGGCLEDARAFVRRQEGWIARQRARLRSSGAGTGRPLRPGDVVLLHGVPTPILIDGGPGQAWPVVRLGDEVAVLEGGVPADLAPTVRQVLRAIAARELPRRLLALAQVHRLLVTRILVRDQQSRWGSCSRRGTISLNWRLVQMPPEVRDYVLIHELMHLREPNHSRRFWKHVHRACPWHLAARRWLRREGPSLL